MYLVANWISNGWEKDEWMNVPGCKMNICWMRKGWMNKCMYQVTRWNIYWIRKGWMNEYTRLQNEYLLDEKRMKEWMYLVAKWISIGWEKDKRRNIPGCKMNIYWMRKEWMKECTWLQNEYLLDEKSMQYLQFLGHQP